MSNFKKLILCEPYSYKGGHPLKNLDLFSINTFNGLKVNLFTDINKRTKSKKEKFYFTEGHRFESYNFFQRVKVRENEFKKLLNSNRDSIIVFFTTHEEDITAWLELIKKGIERLLEEKNIFLVIHSGYAIYHSMYKYKKVLLNISRKNVIFTFFTEFQMFAARRLFNSDIFSYLYFPHYIHKGKKNKDKRILKQITYIGIYAREKNPHIIYPLSKNMNDYKFIFHINRINENNLILFKSLKKLKNVTLIKGSLDEKKYKEIINRASFIILPYDSFEYSIRGSGIFEEAVMNGAIPIVPEETWMGYKAKEYISDIICFKDGVKDIEKTIRRAEKRYDEIISKLEKAREIFTNERRIEYFLKKIVSFPKEKYKKEDKKLENVFKKYENIIKKGIFTYYVKSSLFFKWRGESKIADELYKEAKVYKHFTHSSLYQWAQEIFEGKKDNIINLSNLSFPSFWNFKNSFRKIKSVKEIICNLHFISIPSILNLINNNFFDNNSLLLLKKKITSLGINRNNKDLKELVDIIDLCILCIKKSELKNCIVYLKNNLKTLSLRFVLPFLFNMINDKAIFQNKEELKDLLMELKKIKKKQTIDFYRLGSLLKIVEENKSSKYYFKNFLKKSNNALQKSGAYFHLGEIEYERGNYKKAISYFKKCIKLNPYHKKAMEYLIELNKDE